MERFARNKHSITAIQQEQLAQKKVLVVGCGGLGTHVLEGLARIGIKQLGFCDYDVFEASNLNRQLNALEHTIGKPKALMAYERIKSINSEIKSKVYTDKYPSPTIIDDLPGYDLVIDCLDSIATRKQLEIDCIKLGKTLIYGAIAGHFGYFGVITKDNPLIAMQENQGESIEKQLGNPYYTVATIASMQLMLATRVLLNQEYHRNGFYVFDLAELSIDKITTHIV